MVYCNHKEYRTALCSKWDRVRVSCQPTEAQSYFSQNNGSCLSSTSYMAFKGLRWMRHGYTKTAACVETKWE